MTRRPRVLVCRGCCCGTERKHPDTDHDAQLAALAAVARTRVVGCVDACSQSNVVIVRPGDGTSRWFGRVLSPEDTERLCDWLATGADEPLPAALAALQFDPRGGDVAATPVTLVAGT